jgi:hypothetical protein
VIYSILDTGEALVVVMPVCCQVASEFRNLSRNPIVERLNFGMSGD